jgi:hypothetical protein
VGAAVLALLALCAPLRAQSAAIAVDEENLRVEPRGAIMAELLEGTLLALGEDRGQWREVTLEAWIWGRSVREQQGALDLIVNASGENLRASPNGARLGRALGGMRLERLETRGDWLRVRRTGWIWAASLEPRDVAVAGVPVPAPLPAPTTPRPTGRDREFAAMANATTLLDQPGGDTIARVHAGSSVEVLAREGDWSRVRIEGWAFSGALAGADGGSQAILPDVPRDSLEAHPERYRGRLVEWTVQFIALQTAERFRTDFVLGEPFMLTRGPGEDPGFVYVAVPPDRRAEVERLAPLQRIRIVARIRTTKSSLTGAPVVDLLEITGR